MAIATQHRYSQPKIPTEDETKLSQQSSRILGTYVSRHSSTNRLKVVADDGSEQSVTIPATAFHLLVDILSQMAQGNAVTFIPIHAELTTQEAADLLNVSRPFVIKLIESKQIPARKVGRHRRIRFEDLMKYKERTDAERLRVLDELALQAQELDMSYE
jgi:excisionase family DNA binding protein